jgi:competence protein ComEC
VRKLALTAGFFSAAIFVSQYLLPPDIGLYSGLALLLLFIALLFVKRLKVLRYISLGLALGLIWNFIYISIALKPARELDGLTKTVTAAVLAPPEDTDYGKSVLIRTEGVKARLYIYNEDYTELHEGDEISIRLRFVLTSKKTGTEYYNSIGIPLFAYAEGRPELTGSLPFKLRFIPARAGRKLGDKITEVFSAYSAPFIKALITGDRAELRDNNFIYSMMNVTGIIHCVSVSGMHVAFLAGLLYFLLGKGRLSSVICVPVILLFMAMTGFSPSVVRAGIMQLAVCAANLTRREYDGRTALFFSLALLLAVNPFSAQNAGLQLSFAATLGILLFNERLSQYLFGIFKKPLSVKLLGKALRWLLSALSVSLSAMVFTIPLTAIIFERVSVIAPLTNLLTLWALSLCFILGLIAALLGFIFMPAAVIIAYPVEMLVKFIYAVISVLGRLPFASVYTDSIYIRFWLVFIYASFSAALFIRDLRHRLACFLTASLASLLIALSFSLIEGNRDAFVFTALNVGQGQCIIITARDYTAVIDCGGSLSQNAGDLAADYLSSLGRTRVDNLMLTHYHQDHSNGAEELFKRLEIEALTAPLIEGEGEEIFDLARAEGAEITLLTDEVLNLNVGSISFVLIPPLDTVGENEIGMSVLCSFYEFDCLVTGDMNSQTELRLLERLRLPDIELMVAGHHGSKNSSSEDLLNALKPEAAIISVGKNSYGHPSAEVLDRLADNGVTVYRTDERGNIRISYNGEED